MKGLYEILGVSLGVLLTALGLDLFLIPNKIAAGGVSGIATILHYLIHAPVGITMLVLNVPLFVLGILRLGLPFGFRSLYGTISLSLAIDLLAPVLPVPTQDVLLASLYGGVLVGLGLGLVFRYKGTTGGTDLAAAVLRTYTGANIGRLLFLVDGAVVLAAWVTFDSAELAMYALLTIFIVSWLIDVVQGGHKLRQGFSHYIPASVGYCGGHCRGAEPGRYGLVRPRRVHGNGQGGSPLGGQPVRSEPPERNYLPGGPRRFCDPGRRSRSFGRGF